MYESISKNKELENEVSSDMSYFWYSDVLCIMKWCSETPLTMLSNPSKYLIENHFNSNELKRR